jgi:hypothetical protein
MPGGVRRSAPHCIGSPRRCSREERSGRPHVRAGPAPPRSRAAGGVRSRATSVGACFSGGCVRRRVRRAGGRAGGQWVRCARGARSHCGGARRAAVLPCCRAARIRSLATTTEAVGKLSLGFRHTARHRLRRAVCEGVGSRGSLEPGAMEQRALRMPSPLLRGAAWWWGVAMGSAPERGDGEGAAFHHHRKTP